MTHPILRDPERQRAYEVLKSMPTGTERSWAEALGWNHVRVRRFIAALERQRLVSVTRTRYGTRLDFGECSEAEAYPLHTRSTGVAKPKHLDMLDDDRLDPVATALIEVMNDELTRRFPEWYRPVMSDNKSSQEAGGRIRQAGVPIERAIEILRMDCRKFHPEKHGRGEPPYSLAYFEKGILQRWRADQLPLGLLNVERPAKSRDRARNDKPAPIAEALEAFDWRKALGK